MIFITVLMEALAIWLATIAFTLPASRGTWLIGVLTLVIWNLVLACEWLKWSARHRN
jgi:hypothetical protein